MLAERGAVPLVVAGGAAREAARRDVARWRTATSPHYEAPPRRRLGGRSLAWHGVVLRVEDWALDDARWPPALAAALRRPSSGGRGLYDEVEADLAQWSRRGLDVARAGDAALLELLQTLAPSVPLPVPQAVRDPAAAGEAAVYTPLERWLGLGRTQPPALVADVVELVVRRGAVRAVRLVAGGDPRTLPCSRVVLAAGTLENTRLVAQALGVKRVGGLADHLVQGFVVAVPCGFSTPPPPGFVFVRGSESDRCNIFVRTRAVAAEDGSPRTLIDAWAMGEQLSPDSGGISFDSRDGLPWWGTVTPTLSPADTEVVERERELLAQVHGALSDRFGLPAQPPSFPDFLREPKPFPAAVAAALATDDGVPAAYTWPLGAVEHEGGTLPLGERLDERGELRDVGGVFVVGPCTFPRAGAANPSLTTIALARHTARAVAAG